MSSVASDYKRMRRVILLVVFGFIATIGGIGLWATESWDLTGEPRFLSYVAWDILGGLACFGIYRIAMYAAFGAAWARAGGGADAYASRSRVTNVDADAIRAALVRCEDAGCPSSLTGDVALLLERGPNDAVRRAILDRLYSYSAFSTDPYELRRAANELRVAINPWSPST